MPAGWDAGYWVMRNPGSPMWARCIRLAAALIAAVHFQASGARAQEGTLCTLPTEMATVLALTRGNVANVTNTPPPTGTGLVTNPLILPPASGGTGRRTEICTNRLEAPKTIVIQPGTVVVATGGFLGALLGRLDGARGHSAADGPGPGTDGLMGLGRKEKSPPPPGPASPFTVYAMGSLLGGTRADAPNLSGFGYDATSGTIGLEYAINRNLIVGLAGNTTITAVDVHNGATVDVSAIQLAAYLSYATKQWFVDAMAAAGSHELDLVRPGVVGPLRSSTDACALALAVRGGYLFDFGGVRAGPIAGLTYIHSRVSGYVEKGDPDLAFTVSSLTFDNLAGSAGIRFLTSFQVGGTLVVPYLNVTLEHLFGDRTRTLTATLTQLPALPPVLVPVPSFDARNFGKIEGGITLQLGADFSASLSAATTFGRDEGHDFRVSTGLSFRF